MKTALGLIWFSIGVYMLSFPIFKIIEIITSLN